MMPRPLRRPILLLLAALACLAPTAPRPHPSPRSPMMPRPLRRPILLLLAALACLAPTAARADLDAYLRKPEPVYRWEKRGMQEMEGCKVYDLHLVSQEWQGITWQHRLQVFRPEKLEHPEFCTLYNTGGSGSNANTQMGLR